MKFELGCTFVAMAALAACGVEGTSEPSEIAGDSLVAAATCPRPLPAADRTRKVVVSHAFGDNPNRYEVLDLSRTGRLTRTGRSFEMGRSNNAASISFTPDGKVGFVPQDGGSIGVFGFGANGAPVVIDPGFKGPFYARTLIVHPDGQRLFVSDGNVPENGGGVYEVTIGCDGRLTNKGLVVPGGPAYTMAFLPNDPSRAVLYGGKAFDSAEASDVFLLDLGRPRLVAQGDAFGDHNAIASSTAVTFDGKYALVGDDGLGVGNRVSVVALPSMARKQILETRSPFAIVMSPFENAAIVVNGDNADAITRLRYDSRNTSTPFTIAGPVTTSSDTLLPGAAVQITRGSLKGRVLVSELVTVRQLQFASNGRVTDAGEISWGQSIDGMVGTVGVQP